MTERMPGCECHPPHYQPPRAGWSQEEWTAGRLLIVLKEEGMPRRVELEAIASFVRAWLERRSA